MKTYIVLVIIALMFITVAHMESNEAKMIKDFKANKEMQNGN